MEEYLSESNKCCYTCALWGGSRTIDPNRIGVMVDSGSQGKCHLKNCDMSACSECHKWEKWPLLR